LGVRSIFEKTMKFTRDDWSLPKFVSFSDGFKILECFQLFQVLNHGSFFVVENTSMRVEFLFQTDKES